MMRITAFRNIAPLAGCLVVCAYASEQKLAPSDLVQGRQYLEQTRTGVIGATKGLSDAQWKFKPAPDRWSIAEIVEHMVLTQELILGPIREQLAKAPVAANPDSKQVDGLVLHQFPDRLFKLQAPEVLRPTGRWEPTATLDRLIKNYDRLIEYLESTPDLRQHALEAAPLKAISKGAYESMDGYEWLLATGAHVERHTKQILEVKADAGFPAK